MYGLRIEEDDACTENSPYWSGGSSSSLRLFLQTVIYRAWVEVNFCCDHKSSNHRL
jgi:hypothetical protein